MFISCTTEEYAPDVHFISLIYKQNSLFFTCISDEIMNKVKKSRTGFT